MADPQNIVEIVINLVMYKNNINVVVFWVTFKTISQLFGTNFYTLTPELKRI